MSDNIMKKRLLMLIKLLQDHTDEEHPVSTRDIMAYYKENGMSSDRKTLDADIKLLQEQGFDLIKIKSSPNKYYIASREFELPELKLLIDAVQSSRFITEKKSRELSKKLAGLASAEQAKELDRHTGVNGRAKSTNEQQLYTVDTITKAINEKKKIRYQYQEYDGKKRKILRNDGEVYVLSPYMLYWNEDFYYVVGYSDKRECITAFRVDRIVNIEITDAKAVKKPKGFKVSNYSSSIFGMYSGPEAEVELECRNDLMKYIIDRFGERIKVRPTENGMFLTTVTVELSPVFYGWVFQFGGGIKITNPKFVKMNYEELLNKAIGK